MPIAQRAISSLNELIEHIDSGRPSLYCCSKTSTVIDFDRLGDFLPWDQELTVVDLTALPKAQSILPDGRMRVSGAVTWEDAEALAGQHGRALKTVPSEPLASIIAGCATSASGERGFSFGSFRDHISALTYVDHRGRQETLSGSSPLIDHPLFASDTARHLLEEYQNAHRAYAAFKNGPAPRLTRETDLLVGSEGQLGVVVGVVFETAKLVDEIHIMLELPPWDRDMEPHLRFFHAVQSFRGDVIACEFVDHHCLKYANPSNRFPTGSDLIFLQLEEKKLDDVFERLIRATPGIDPNRAFQIPHIDFLSLRAAVPRSIAEVNRKNSVIKRGTDIQVAPKNFADLMGAYRKAVMLDIPVVLFGHFGDAHLHFNFLPHPGQLDRCDAFLDRLYDQVRLWRGSPSAEHGVGLIKQTRISPFLTPAHRRLFAYLKAEMDPRSQFFPQGFM